MTIALSMIVKNEAHVIRRCLDSIRSILDYWVIVDTGSTDGTQDVIREYMGHYPDLPGELHERPWVDFATNRNQAIELCVGKATHAFVLDADDVVEVHRRPARLTEDCYRVRVRYAELDYSREHVFRPELPQYRYAGVRHEYLRTTTERHLEGVTIRIVGGGARSQDTEKFKNDALALEAALETETDEGLRYRYTFYLAQSWRDAGMLEEAAQRYEERAAMDGGFVEERFVSLLERAKILARQKKPYELAFLRAAEFRMSRAEPFYELALALLEEKRFALAACFADMARKIPQPEDVLFVNHEIYSWRAALVFSIAADYVPGRRAQAIEAGTRLLKTAPEYKREQIAANIASSKAKLKTEGR